jgi:hypothetical protein
MLLHNLFGRSSMTLPHYILDLELSLTIRLTTLRRPLPQVTCTSAAVTPLTMSPYFRESSTCRPQSHSRPCHRHAQHIITLTSCLRLQCSSRVGTPVSSSILVVPAREFDFTDFLLTRVTYISWATLPFCFAFSTKPKVARHQKN